MENKYYIYLHIKLTNGEPFYVGRGCGQRAHTKNGRTDWWNKVVNKHGYDIIKLEEGLSNSKANELEIYWIDRIGRRDLGKGTLVNHTEGGDGSSGYKHTDESKKKISEASVGRKGALGYNHTDEAKKKISEAHKGRVPHNKKYHTEEEKRLGYKLRRKIRYENRTK